MKRLHLQHQYSQWAKNRVLPNPGDAETKAKRFLHHLFKTGEISQDERTGWLAPLTKDIIRLGWDSNPKPKTKEEHNKMLDEHELTRRILARCAHIPNND